METRVSGRGAANSELASGLQCAGSEETAGLGGPNVGEVVVEAKTVVEKRVAVIGGKTAGEPLRGFEFRVKLPDLTLRHGVLRNLLLQNYQVEISRAVP